MPFYTSDPRAVPKVIVIPPTYERSSFQPWVKRSDGA